MDITRSTDPLQSVGETATRRLITSLDEFTDPLTTAHMHPMAIGPGDIRAEIVTANLRGVLISTGDYSFPVATRGETLARRVAIVLPSRGIPSAHVNGTRVAPGVAYAFGGSAEVAAATAGPVKFATMSLSPDALDRMALDLGIEIDLPGRGEFRLVRAAHWAPVRHLLFDVMQSVRETVKPVSSGQEAAAVADALVEFCVRCFAADGDRATLPPHARLNSVHIVRVSEECATASRYQSVTLRDLCRASGVSERRVRHAFYECYGMSPTAYLRIAALNEVRRELLEGPSVHDAVSRAASDFGFWHLSRFAGQYRALFGESPSATLARRSKVVAG